MIAAPAALRLATASLDVTVGDHAGNLARCRRAVDEARRRGAALLALPEMALSGYSLGDRVFHADTVARAWASLEALAADVHDLVVTVGLPVRHGGALLDVVAVLASGRVHALVPKENLATGEVEYETRWFQAWRRGRVEPFQPPTGEPVPLGHLVFEAGGIGRFAVEVCEDGWKGNRPGSLAALAGATVVINASASWFVVGKQARRRRLVEAVSAEDRVAYVYSSLHGCDATRVVFDGATFIAADGAVLAEGPRFVQHDDVVVVDAVVDVAALLHGRVTEGSWRQQEAALAAGDFGPPPTLVQLPPVGAPRVVAPAPAPWWAPPPPRSVDPSLDWLVGRGLLPPLSATTQPHAELELALATGLGSYLRKSGLSGAALALSGGRDSAMCAVLTARALRYAFPDEPEAAHRARVRASLVTAWLGTENSSAATQQAAAAVAADVGAEHVAIEVDDIVAVHAEAGARLAGRPLTWAEDDLTLQNLQARARGVAIWTLANQRGRLLLTTSNLSEGAVGYCTMDGDTAGGLAPIAGVPKSLVSAWLAWARQAHELPSLDLVLAQPATAELRPLEAGQTDEADLMPYDVLDRILWHAVGLGEAPMVLARRLWPELAGRYGGQRAAFAAHVRRFFTLLVRAQWKRDRLAVSFRVHALDLDPQGGFRFPAIQDAYVAELADLDAWASEATDG